ncbi:MAG: M24 family metallopeptidase [Clostridia bacterium]|nr:M24 family metallopeptidase [Clostridia bacterium]
MVAIIVEDSDLVFYYTGYRVDDGFAVILSNETHLLTDMRYYYAITPTNKLKVHLTSNVTILGLLKELKVSEVGLVLEHTSAKLYSELVSNGFKVYDASAVHYKKASVKNKNELELLKRSASVCENALINVIPLIKEGVTELEIAGAIEYEFKKLGAVKPSFETIVAFGEGSAIPHYQTSSVKLKKNVPILIDFGCIYGGYASDMTRTFYYGAPSCEFERRYGLVLSAHELAVNFIRAGVTGAEADGCVRKYFESCGISNNFTHSLGHGVGVKVHEEPRLSRLNESELENGNVFTIEPGLYFDGEYGIRIEDTYALLNGVPTSLFTIDKKLKIIQ